MSQRLLPELSATVAPMKFRTRRLLVSVPAAWMLTRASTASLVTIRVTVALSAWEAAVEPPSARTTVQVNAADRGDLEVLVVDAGPKRA